MARSPWRLARSLERLREQINARFPDRDKRVDGTIGDAAHASRESDHNPHIRDGSMGVVSALDLTHCLRSGMNTWVFADHLRQQADPRIKYVISNRRIFSSTTSPFVWRHYTGSNPHSSHIHISVRAQRAYFDDTADWDIGFAGSPGPAVVPGTPDPDSPTLRPVLRQGSRGEDVRTVQRLLQLAAVDGVFGPVTDAAVRAFQRREKLVVDGVVGPVTWGRLDLIEQVVLPFNYAPPRELSEPE